jgi:hypothetical protein
MNRNIKSQFWGFLLGAITIYLFWVILDLITIQAFRPLFFLIYWDIMLAFEIILAILSLKRKW